MTIRLSSYWRILRFCALALCCGLAGAAVAAETPGSLGRTAPTLNQRPMDIYVATGPADACGSGCSEWIAVDGRFDVGAGKRFRDFLEASPRRRTLPVFFHSPGGVLSAAFELALTLRENGMTAGVARTTQQGCTVQRVPGGNCDIQVKSGNDVPSQFIFDGSQCHSACVYALAGAAVRRIAPAARVGVHSPKIDELAWKQFVDQHPGARRLTDEERSQGLWRFVLALGVDPALVELAAKVDHNTIRVLSRDELVRYGLESSDRFETPWIMRRAPDGPVNLIKSVTTSDHVTAVAQIACSNIFGYRLTLARALPKDQFALPPPAQLSAGDARMTLLPSVAKSVAYWTTVARPDEMKNLVALPQFGIDVVYARGPETAVPIKISTAGLAAALDELQIQCSERKLNTSAGRPSTD